MPTHTHLNRVKPHLDRECACMCNLHLARDQQVSTHLPAASHRSDGSIIYWRRIWLDQASWLLVWKQMSWCCACVLTLEGHKLWVTVYCSSALFNFNHSGWWVRVISAGHFSLELFLYQKYSMFYQEAPYFCFFYISLRFTHHSYVSYPPELLCVPWASFYWKPVLSAETWLPQLNPSGERSDPPDPERESLQKETGHYITSGKEKQEHLLFHLITM